MTIDVWASDGVLYGDFWESQEELCYVDMMKFDTLTKKKSTSDWYGSLSAGHVGTR